MGNHLVRALVTIVVAGSLIGCEKLRPGGVASYTNARFGYSLKYRPSTWSLDSGAGGQASMVTVHQAKSDPLRPGGNSTVTSVTVENLENPSHLGLESLYSSLNAAGDSALARAGAPPKAFAPIQFAGQPALKITTPGLASYHVYLPKRDGAVLDIALDILGDESDTSALAEAEAIVASVALR